MLGYPCQDSILRMLNHQDLFDFRNLQKKTAGHGKKENLAQLPHVLAVPYGYDHPYRTQSRPRHNNTKQLQKRRKASSVLTNEQQRHLRHASFLSQSLVSEPRYHALIPLLRFGFVNAHVSSCVSSGCLSGTCDHRPHTGVLNSHE